MSESERPTVFVHLLPTLIPPGALRGGVAVVIDVLRATTVMVQALASGCEAIIPCAEIEEAKAVAASLPAGRALLAGERQGLPIPGFDLGNSPDDFTPEVCRGKALVMTTTNGTRAILASREADLVRIAAFSNLSATIEALVADARPVHLVCAGTDGEVSLEDTLLAGAFVGTDLDDWPLGNDAARVARIFWKHFWLPPSGRQTGEGARPIREAEVQRLIQLGRGAARVREINHRADIYEAARVNLHPFTAVLRPGTMTIVRE